jgi:SAM-dependent methyltransferase
MDKKTTNLNAYKDSISITHRHILSVLNTLFKSESQLKNKEIIRILDAGCGNGKMILYLNKYLPLYNPGKKLFIYGYDVLDHGVQKDDYAKETFSYLSDQAPEINWKDRIRMINSHDDWPFESKTFDIVLSNQVVEHVWDHDHFFREHSRVMNDKAFGVHIIPFKEAIIDWHICLPRVHKINNWESIYRKIRFYTKLGISIRYNKEKYLYKNDKNQFSKIWADKIYHYCNYKNVKEISSIAKKNHLCFTSKFTFNYYFRKFSEVFGLKPDFEYTNKKSSKLIFFFCKHITGVSVVLYKGEYSTY